MNGEVLLQIAPELLDMEDALIAALVRNFDNSFWTDCPILNELKPADFFRERNRFVFQEIVNMRKRNESVNIISIRYRLSRKYLDKYEEVFGKYFKHVYPEQSEYPLWSLVHVQDWVRHILQASSERRVRTDWGSSKGKGGMDV